MSQLVASIGVALALAALVARDTLVDHARVLRGLEARDGRRDEDDA